MRKAIKKIHVNKPYSDGDAKIMFDEDYDYCLFRQDYHGAEIIYFNKEKLKAINKQIDDGKIRIHPNYSVLYAKTKELVDDVKVAFPCYVVLWRKKNKLKKSNTGKEYEKVMIPTGLTDEFRGREYLCPKCNNKYWSAWGWARRHYEACCKVS
jgi:hypothetical protein